ncbi:hypothetical protein A2291_03065 [candidate division WOR-1 bacterium RIFOXYB2_FULL_42_35]|uniref:NAD-dependent epimerase/dehydratase domain-containing protein n=1 Tax=candidate division WOR-1 bacterium RIFOXYC2_FULL_41_25 TaxID=1802586 RepID=A0A1F4TR36_UNCSA|nr:MAG: hypothetical protein A2247_01375 [candidate division WOR-1 bacterium RIFOXYA2_FULL_41_14]OGC25726.1 MAG: hypothetical protein A2291_03065 [candidate division WOR-1 bacterium RIFOXYB2_FULL_42_35]OGC35128.1 MAG: hypothetical protein A2462_06210 [candidate division WOR-1 bacterium RIFOXYC2_FULL_41_25]OGC42197.1 MAG: hypothetical protein A2548_03555 [candidate division WOR-1 bacterium RIFOXYD2_FULL_41_8]
MKILVTGGSGFIGSQVVDKLVVAGHDVRILDVKPPQRNDLEFVQGSFVDQAVVEKTLQGIEVIYHIGGFSNIDLAKANPVEVIRLNVLGTTYLLDAARKNGIRRFIFASSVYVHDEKGHLYTTSKLAAEMLCKNFSLLYGLPYTILRYGTVYGPRSRQADVISLFVAKALKGEELIIHGSGQQRRNFIYVEDLAFGSVAALQSVAENKTYVLAGKSSVAIKELAELIKKIFKSEPVIKFLADTPRNDDYSGEIKGLDLAFQELNWLPQVGLDEGIRKYCEWLGKSR